MKLLAIIALAVVIVLLVLATRWVVNNYTNWRRQHEEEHGEWRVKERPLPGRREIGVYLISPGGKAQLFGEPISNKLPEYEFLDRIEEARIGAHARAETLNRKLLP